jgi:hypothetical protein
MTQPLIWKWWLNEWNRRDADNLKGLYEIYGDNGTIAEWLAKGWVDFEDSGLVVGPEGLSVGNGLSVAERELRYCEVMVHYRCIHQIVFIKYTPPYHLLDKGWEKVMQQCRKGNK